MTLWSRIDTAAPDSNGDAQARLATFDSDKLHDLIYRLAQRRRAGDRACNELLGKLLDEMDRRGDSELE